MRIGVLATGDTPARLTGRFGHYSEMFQSLLTRRGYDWNIYDTPNGDYPDRLEDCDAYIVTGSAASVYADEPWIGALMDFLRAAKGRTRLVGVCFGHQALAQAFGGTVIKSPKGWGIGRHTYTVEDHRPWMDGAARAFSLAASHQDQVVALPPDAHVLAGSDFCRNGMIAYEGGMAISLQLHAEFPPAYSIALIGGRSGSHFPAAEADAAIESLRRPDDHGQVAGWIARFLEG